jgi:hypothetical protein
MITKSPALQETLDYLNRQEFAEFIDTHKKAHTVMVGNGVKKEMPLNEAVGFLYDKSVENRNIIDKIYEDTTVLRDANTLFTIVKKYKYLFGGGLVGVVATAIRIWIG